MKTEAYTNSSNPYTILRVVHDLGRSASGHVLIVKLATLIDQAFAARLAFAGRRNRTGIVMR